MITNVNVNYSTTLDDFGHPVHMDVAVSFEHPNEKEIKMVKTLIDSCSLETRPDKERKMRTITIDEFKKLVPIEDHQKRRNENLVHGRFGINAKVQEAQCEDLEVGKLVFFLKSVPNLDDSDVKSDITVVQANVVE